MGYYTESSINNNQYLHCNGVKYHAPIEFLDYKRKSDAMLVRWIPGILDRVWVYHEGDYLGEWGEVVKPNQAQVEMTERDKQSLEDQLKYRAKYDKMMKVQKAKVKAVEVRKVKDKVRDINDNRGAAGDIYDMDEVWA